MKKNKGVLRLTGLYMLRRLWRLGLRKNAVGLRPLCVFVPPHFCKPWKPTVSFIGLAKTSYTAGTLCAIFLKLIEKIVQTIDTKK
jgi:hypothetical protein